MIVNSILLLLVIVGFALDYHRVLLYDPKHIRALQIVHEYKTRAKSMVVKEDMEKS